MEQISIIQSWVSNKDNYEHIEKICYHTPIYQFIISNMDCISTPNGNLYRLGNHWYRIAELTAENSPF